MSTLLAGDAVSFQYAGKAFPATIVAIDDRELVATLDVQMAQVRRFHHVVRADGDQVAEGRWRADATP